MSSFRDRSFETRYSAMGDQAEKEFEDWMRGRKLGFIRTGLERPPIQVHRLPKHIRYLPDYLTSKCWVEVQGFGRDQVVKLKFDKLNALEWWDQEHPVELFLYDSHNRRHGQFALAEVKVAVKHSVKRRFREGTPYHAIQASEFFGADTT